MTVTTVNDEDNGTGALSLREALKAAALTSDEVIINFDSSLLPGTINLTMGMLPTATGTVTIDGSSADELEINGGDVTSIFSVAGGNLTLLNMKVADGLARGGDGGDGAAGGGGGGGLGGALFISSGQATARHVVFDSNSAIGGNGGDGGSDSHGGGGGGGTNGANGASTAGSTIPGGNGGNSSLLTGTPGTGGASEGNDGGSATGDCDGGGGGARGGVLSTGGDGGSGTFGSGAGGGGGDPLGTLTALAGGNGGDGGFAGGGGGAGGSLLNLGIPGDAGTFGGDGQGGFVLTGSGGGGGGGGGLGGAIFVRAGATCTLSNVEFTNNTATGGFGGDGAAAGTAVDGRGNGAAIFAMATADVAANCVTFSGNSSANSAGGTGFIPSTFVNTADVHGTLEEGPTLDLVSQLDATPTSSAAVSYVYSFSEPINGLDTTDFFVHAGGGVVGASIISVSNVGGPNYEVEVNTGSGNGGLRVELLNTGTVTSPVTGTVLSFCGANPVSPPYIINKTGSVFSPTGYSVVINELDTYTGIGDPQEYIELYNPTDTTVDLGADGYVVVFYDGATDAVYAALDLTGMLASNDFFLLGNVAGANQALPSTSFIQNGADGIAIFRNTSASLFTVGTPVTTIPSGAVRLDAVVTGTSDPPDQGLLAALMLPGQPQLNENAEGDAARHALGRCPDGAGGPFRSSIFQVGPPTPGFSSTADCGADTDLDGLPDTCETSNAGTLSAPGSQATNLGLPDSDLDGLLDGEEEHGTCSTSPAQELTQTSPRDQDSDNDGWADGLEHGRDGTFPNGPGSSDPGISDGDGDGLSDSIDPDDSDPDTDDDGFSDWYEVAVGTDPANSSSRPMLGDVNLDLIVDLVDVAELADFNLALITFLRGYRNADMNGDAIVDINDVALIADYNLGLVMLP